LVNKQELGSSDPSIAAGSREDAATGSAPIGIQNGFIHTFGAEALKECCEDRPLAFGSGGLIQAVQISGTVNKQRVWTPIRASKPFPMPIPGLAA